MCLLALGASACRQRPAEGELCPPAPAPLGELRLTARCASAHRPLPPPGARTPELPIRAMAALEAHEEWTELAAAWLRHDGPGQAALVLQKVTRPTGRDDLESDLAAVAFARGDAAEALERLDAVLERRPDHPQALWNRGVVLASMDPALPRLAAESFERAAGLGEPGWSEEARAWAARLRDESSASERAWKEARDAIRATAADPRRPLAAEAIARAFPGMAREELYRALRSARGPECAKALLPLAEALDRASGGTSLHDRVLRAAPDREDPWLQLDAEIERAAQEVKQGSYGAGAARLEAVLGRCGEARLPYLCLRALRELSAAGTSANQLARAEAQAREQLHEAHRLGEWEQETAALKELAQALRFQVRWAPARAILGEVLARAAGDGATCSYVHRNLAAIFLRNLRFEAARREIDLALQCGQPIMLNGAAVLSELARVLPEPADAANLEKAIRDEGLGDKSQGRKNLALFVRGRFELFSHHAAGRTLLRQAIASSEPLLDTDASSRDAWSQSFQDLALDAAWREDWSSVLALAAERLQVGAPDRCALVVLVDAERTAVVALGAAGALEGRYDARRRTPLVGTLEGLVPPELLARLEGCARVDVLATSPIDTRSGLLPSRIAWAYRGGTARAPGPPRPQRRLVIADVEAPASLHLPRLPAWSGEAPELAGPDATPARVLKAMTGATLIDLHAHGLVDPLLSGATAIALAPQRDGRYALTAELIRSQARLEGAPVVSLAACAAAWRPAFLHQTASLPQAFISAGARAVLAATVDIPNSGGAFFSQVSERIQAGQEPAQALRDEREAWLGRDPGAAWVKDVLLYE